MRKLNFLALCFLLGLSVYLFREPVFRAIAKSLIKEDKIERADAIVVLSGNSFDRGNKAAALFFHGFAPRIVCPGGNRAYEFEILNMQISEAEAAKINLARLGVPDSCIVIMNAGTSTKEEADLIKQFATIKKYKKLILLTSLYHTRRAGYVFKKALKYTDIKLMVCGAKSSRFDELNWWKTEDGLIAMNNELLKNFYYFLKGDW